LLNEDEGAFVENYVAQQLVSHFNQMLYDWRSKGGKAEIDYLCELAGNIYPLEVKAGLNPKSKRLKSYDQQFSPSWLVRLNLLNFKKDGKTCNLPLYAVSLIPRLIVS
jgi:predicted AAA+ superfamily ATPase